MKMYRRDQSTEGAIRRPAVASAITLGLVAAVIAIGLRLFLSAASAGDQAIFSFPAIIIATIWFGVRAGGTSAAICLLALWYYVVPAKHSFEIASTSGAITLAIYSLVSMALVWGIGNMRMAIRQYRELNFCLERLVEEKTAERDRIWVRSRELIAILNQDGSIHALSPSFLTKINSMDDYVRACEFSDLLEDEDLPRYIEAIDQLRKDDDQAFFDARLRTPGGDIWIAWRAVYDGDFNYLSGREHLAPTMAY